jgi:hypothetical protein
VPPTDGISCRLYVSQSVVCDMATVQVRARCVGWLFETKSVTQTQLNYRTQFNKQPPSDTTIRDWQRRFLETGSVHDSKRCGRPGVSDECAERIRQSLCSKQHGKSLNIVWTFFVLQRECTSRFTRSVKNFRTFTMICRKPHVASSICLRATIFQNPEGTLWTDCVYSSTLRKNRMITNAFLNVGWERHHLGDQGHR